MTKIKSQNQALPFARALLLAVDACIVAFAYFLAFRVRTGFWTPDPLYNPLPSLTVSVLVFVAALVLARTYSIRIRDFHVRQLVRLIATLVIAAAVAVFFQFMINRYVLPPRTVTGIQLLVSIFLITGIRVVYRYWVEIQALRSDAHRASPHHIAISDIIDRPPVEIDSVALSDYLSGRTVLVTGAGGSVGSELCRQLMDLNPFRMVLVDVSEYNLFRLENDLKTLNRDSELQFRIADVRDDNVRQLFQTYRPDIIFHAAAYKHVPLLERHPIEAFRNNTLATITLLRLCEEFGTEQFILVSTDKAVAPTSVLGATKRIAEWYVRAADSPETRKIVRFGNVFGSQGSVVPHFREQILAGGPVTVTHADMQRYFISADEACKLILQTLLLDSDASIYMLRMEPPVKISMLASVMIDRMSPDPLNPAKIEYTGTRPGEKFYEQLKGDEETAVETGHPSILGLASRPMFSRTELDDYLQYLSEIADSGEAEKLRKALFVTELSSKRAVE